jgi:Uma2 family endonuclease
MITLEQEEIQNEEDLSLPPQELIFDDGEPLETARHKYSMDLLIDSIYGAWKSRTDFYAGGNMFIYYSRSQIGKPPKYRGPDFYLVLNTDRYLERKGWVVWEEGGKLPDLIVEFLSPSTRRQDLGPKKDIYQNIFQTKEYFVYDPFKSNSLKGWRLNSRGIYEELTKQMNGSIFSEVTGLYLGTWEGCFRDITTSWIRFFDKDGNLALTHAEEEQLKAEEAQRIADEERRIADKERIKAVEAQRIAKEERLKAEEERRIADEVQKKLQDAEKKILQLEEELKKQKRA